MSETPEFPNTPPRPALTLAELRALNCANNKRKPTLISFFGGPGCGKSTAAMALTTKMKDAGLRVEYAPEFAKTLAWKNAELLGKETVFPIVLGRQVERLLLPAADCDYIITDSPPWMGVAYMERYGEKSEANRLLGEYILRLHGNGYGGVFKRMIDVGLYRGARTYLNCGRSQTREEACKIDDDLVALSRSISAVATCPYVIYGLASKFEHAHFLLIMRWLERFAKEDD